MKIIECPRDAMQGLNELIPTDLKTEYINLLLKVGFNTIDFGSFVSPKAVPQMSDTGEVLDNLDLDGSSSSLLAIVANLRGAQDAVAYDKITYLGYPMSISETFQRKNTNKTIVESLNILDQIQAACVSANKTLVVYISMGFGNPYDDPYDPDVVGQFTGILESMGIKIISLADTIGVSKVDSITRLFGALSTSYPHLELGVHLHSHPDQARDKVQAALDAGCKRIDGAIKGFGGCPMSDQELVGNIATEVIVEIIEANHLEHGLDPMLFASCVSKASEIFPS